MEASPPLGSSSEMKAPSETEVLSIEEPITSDINSMSLFADNIPTLIIEAEATKNLFLENKFVKAVTLAEDSVGFHHIFIDRGVVKYHDLNEMDAEDLRLYRGDVFMTNFVNEMHQNFDDIAKFAQKKFKHQLYECVLSSVSVMKVSDIKVHCDDEGVGKFIVIFNCSEEEYDLSFYDKNDKKVFIGKLAVKPWMTYLLADETRLVYHAVENAAHFRSIVRLGFLEKTSIHDYLLVESTDRYPAEEKDADKVNGIYKRAIIRIKGIPTAHFFGKDTVPNSEWHKKLSRSTFLPREPKYSGHGFLYFSPGHVRDFIPNTLLDHTKTLILELIHRKPNSIRNWANDSRLEKFMAVCVVHFKGLQPSPTVYDIGEGISTKEESYRRSSIVDLNIEVENKSLFMNLKLIVEKVYEAIPDFVKKSVDYPNVVHDININFFTAGHIPHHKDEQLNQAPGGIVVNLYLTDKGALLVFGNHFDGKTLFHRHIEGKGMHMFFADLNCFYDHGVYSKDNLSSSNDPVPLNMEKLGDSRMVVTIRFGYSKKRDQILQKIAFFNEPLDFSRDIKESEKVAAMHDAVKYLKIKIKDDQTSEEETSEEEEKGVEEPENIVTLSSLTPSSLTPSSSSTPESLVTSSSSTPSSSTPSSSSIPAPSSSTPSSSTPSLVKGWTVQYKDMSPISAQAYRVQTFTRTQNHDETYEEGDIFKIIDNEVEKEILILAAIQFESSKKGEPNRLLTFCTSREISADWDNDYFICNAKRFSMLEKKPSNPFPLEADVVTNLVNAHFEDKTSIKETKKTREMWSQNKLLVNYN